MHPTERPLHVELKVNTAKKKPFVIELWPENKQDS